MSFYKYTGVTTAGKNVNGVIDADSQKSARNKNLNKKVI